METQDILAKVKGVVANFAGLEPEDIGDDDAFMEDLELDSLSMMEIWVQIDMELKEHRVKIPNEELPELKTIGQAVARIEQALAVGA